MTSTDYKFQLETNNIHAYLKETHNVLFSKLNKGLNSLPDCLRNYISFILAKMSFVISNFKKSNYDIC